MGSENRLGCPRCQQCPCKDGRNFSEVIDLKGIKIYKHQSGIDSTIEGVGSIDEGSSISYILHNTRGSAIQSADIQSPLEEAYISCPRCRVILQHAQKLLTRIPSIGKNVVIGICDHCKIQQSLIKTCKKCARVIREFLDSREVDYALKEKTIMPWLSTIQKALQSELGKTSAAATSHDSRISRGEPKDLAHKMLIKQRRGFDPAEAPRDGRITLTCPPCESRSMEPMINLNKSPLMDFDFLKRNFEKNKPDFAEFAKQHKVTIQEPMAGQTKVQEKWPSLYHSEESLASVATGKPLYDVEKDIKSELPIPRRSSLKKCEKLRFLLGSRAYHSDEYLNESRNAFQYIFPGIKQKVNPEAQISSSELIKTTLERLKELKIQREELYLQELLTKKEKHLAAKKERNVKHKEVKDIWETSTDISREEKSTLDRKGSLVEGYVRNFETPSKSDDDRQSYISEKGDRVNRKDDKSQSVEKSSKDGKSGVKVKESQDEIRGIAGRKGKDDTGGVVKGINDEKGTSYKDELGKGGKSGKFDKDGNGIVGKKINDDTGKAEGKESKEGTNINVPEGGKDGASKPVGKGGKDRTSKTVPKEDKDENSGPVVKGIKEGNNRMGAKVGKDVTSGEVAKGHAEGISRTETKGVKDGMKVGKGDKEEKRNKETSKSKQNKESANEQAKEASNVPKRKKKLPREDVKLVAKKEETIETKSKNENEELANEEKLDSPSVNTQIHKRPLDKEKTARKIKEDSTRKKLTDKEIKERADLRRKEELDKKLKEYDDVKGVPLLRVVTTTDDKVDELENVIKLTKSQQLLVEKRQREDLVLMKQLEERRKEKQNQIVIKLNSPTPMLGKRQKEESVSATQIVEVEHEEENKESEDENEAYLENYNSDRYKPSEIIVDNNIYKYTKELEAHLAEEELASVLFKLEAEADTPKDLPTDFTTVKKNNITYSYACIPRRGRQMYQLIDWAHERHRNELDPSPKPRTHDVENRRGVTSYALSDRTYIDKGWTMLPTEKVVRKMNIYSMSPAQPQFDWFEHNKSKGTIYYDNGDRMAEFEDNKTARWYYRNGRPALEYYEAEEMNAGQRIVVYSSGEPDDKGRSYPITILATFDYLGNGIVFDHTGKIRMKYNQTEGIMLDRTLGPVTKWKWHSLNDPPVLQQVMIDNQLPIKDETIMQLGSATEDRDRSDNEQMLAIEYDNYIKEKNKNMTRKFKPFQIKMKALKMNENFSLRVLDQANVYLHFRDGASSMKLNLGMKVNNKEILDSDTVEMGYVANPMLKLPAKSDSLARMQRCLSQNQQAERARVEHELKIRPVLPVASLDRMRGAVSRKLRSPFPQGSSARTDVTTDSEGNLQYHCRKACVCNVFHANQLI